MDINFLVFCRVYIGLPHLSIQDASPVQRLVFLDSCGPSGEQCRRHSPNGHTRNGEKQPGQRPLVEKALAGCTNQRRYTYSEAPARLLTASHAASSPAQLVAPLRSLQSHLVVSEEAEPEVELYLPLGCFSFRPPT